MDQKRAENWLKVRHTSGQKNLTKIDQNLAKSGPKAGQKQAKIEPKAGH